MNPVISAQQLSMRFRGCHALRGVDLQVQPGTVFALLGQNGAGKTTLIRILTGFQKPTTGSCQVCGVDPSRQPTEVRRRMGYVPDAPALYDWMTVSETGWFAASFYAPGFLDRFRNTASGFDLPADRKLKHLSKGQRAKVALSLALAHDPELLILDEPTSGLDPLVRREFMESMVDRAATGRSVFLSSHQISEVERVADTVAIMHHGRLQVVAPLDELKSSVSEVTVALQDPLVALPQLGAATEVLSESSAGRQRRLVVRNFQPEAAQRLNATTGVEGITQRPLTLEEIFVAFTQDRAVPQEVVQ